MIVGKKTVLSAIEKEHLPQLLEWRNNPDFRQYYREYRELNLENQTEWWLKNNNDKTWAYFVIKPIENNIICDKIIGIAGLTYIDFINRNAEFAITIGDCDYKNLGYGTDALYTLIKYGFDNLNLHKIYSEVYSNNPCLNLYIKMGFKQEGILRDTYYHGGRYYDSYMLGMMKNELKDYFYDSVEEDKLKGLPNVL